MADVFITPASGKIEFKDGSNNTDAVIELLGSGDLSITSPAGGIQLGDTTSDVYIGDGVSNVDIVFEQNGSIRALSGQTLTLGAAGSNLSIASTITSGATITGQLVASYGDATYGLGSAPSLILGTDGSKSGMIKFLSTNAGSPGYIQQTTNNLHIDTTNGIYLNYYDGNFVAFGTGALGTAAVMGPDGDLWKGSSDNSGTQYVYNSGTWGISITGNSATTTKLATARTINGTSFDGSANITTANWGTARNITIGSTARSVNGSGNVSWSLADIGAADRGLTLTAGDGLTGGGNLTANRSFAVDSTVVRTSENQTIGGTKTFTSTLVGSGSILSYGNASIPALRLDNTASDSATNPWWVTPTGSNWTAGDNKLVFGYGAVSSASSILTINGANSQVGIGNNNPTEKLDVNGNVKATNFIGNLTGNASTATKLATARTIGGVAFDGSANINLPGVNTTGNQNTTGNAATATKLATARTINGTSFDGSANITITANTTNTLTRGSYLTGSNFNGSAATTWAVDATTSNTAGKVVARDGSGIISGSAFATGSTVGEKIGLYGALGGAQSYSIGIENNTQYFRSHSTYRWYINAVADGGTSDTMELTSSGLTVNGTITSTGNMAASTFTGALSGNASTATTLQTARTINGTSFNGSANITTANWGTARTLTIGSTGKSVNGSANVSWSLSEIGVNNSTLTLSTSGIATGSQTWTSNQGSNATFTVNVPATNLSVTAGTTAGPTINSSTGTNVVIPSASATASGVVTTGTQTFAGAKTFSSTISGSVSGNAGTATKLATPITINGTSFDGSANITITANTTNTLTRGSYLTGSNFNGSADADWAVDATTTASNSKIVARDSSGKIRYKNQTDRFSTTTAQTLTNNTWNNKITWTTSIGDGPATHSSGVISVSVAGYYLVTTSVEFLSQATPTGLRAVRIYKNTTPLVQQTLVADVATTAPPFLAVSDVVYLNGTTDTVAIHAYQSQGSAINTGTTVGSSVTITYLGD